MQALSVEWFFISKKLTMANHRMSSYRIANSARFLQMPEGSQLLYFHMILRADDDGVVEAYPLLKLLGSAPDSFKILLAKGFIKQLNEDQVVIILDWKEHNKIRADRKIDSIYKNIIPPEIELLEAKTRADTKKRNGQPMDGQWTTNGRHKLSKVKLSKVNIDVSFNNFWERYPKKELKKKAKEIWLRKKLDFKLDEILLFIEKAKNTDRWKKGFIKQPTTFLNGECWNDDLASYGGANTNNVYKNKESSIASKLTEKLNEVH